MQGAIAERNPGELPLHPPDSTSFHPGYNKDIKPLCFRYNARLSKFET